MTIACEEINGPVMCILKYRTLDEAIERANDNKYGLAAGVLTRNLENAIKVASNIRAGTVWVNCYAVHDPNCAFGGFKDSGLGRMRGVDHIYHYCESKTIVIKTAEGTLP
mmetsp:Transcript_11436/g.5752  ORF Transcript_11436/g.5752 Transcript_11436/m.5752 type:complete len:110 (+) Transcript_11436:346-675(+)